MQKAIYDIFNEHTSISTGEIYEIFPFLVTVTVN